MTWAQPLLIQCLPDPARCTYFACILLFNPHLHGGKWESLWFYRLGAWRKEVQVLQGPHWMGSRHWTLSLPWDCRCCAPVCAPFQKWCGQRREQEKQNWAFSVPCRRHTSGAGESWSQSQSVHADVAPREWRLFMFQVMPREGPWQRPTGGCEWSPREPHGRHHRIGTPNPSFLVMWGVTTQPPAEKLHVALPVSLFCLWIPDEFDSW